MSTETNQSGQPQNTPLPANATAQTEEVGYGYTSDEVKQNPFVFGGNFGVTKMVKFEWIPNGGKEGVEQEALDIVFNINGTEKSYRRFPVTKVFAKDGGEITDINSSEYKEARREAQTDFNAVISHIMGCFIGSETWKSTVARPISGFKEFCRIAMGALPSNYKERPLDIFLQYQWQLRGEQKKTYLDIPSKMKYGAWLTPAQPGPWKEVRVEEPTESTPEALYYITEAGIKHRFIKTGWFMKSNFARQQKAEGTESDETTTQAADNMNSGANAAPDAAQSNSAGTASTW